MSASSKATDQTNQNQAALATQQQQTQAQLISAQQANDALINADLGTAHHVPAPTGIPSVTAAMGPTESALLGALSVNNIASTETGAAAAVDPNESGILATFANSAATTQAGLSANSAATLEAITLGQATQGASLAAQTGALVSSLTAGSAASQYAMAQEAGGGGQGIANPLGTQVTSVPTYTTDPSTTSATSSGISPIAILAIVAAGGGAWWWFEHKKAA